MINKHTIINRIIKNKHTIINRIIKNKHTIINRIIKNLGLPIGLSIFIFLISQINYKLFMEQVIHLGPFLFIVMILMYPLVLYIDTISWRMLLPSANYSESLTLWRMTKIKYSSYFVKYTTPFGSLFSDPFQAHLLKKLSVPFVDGMSSLYLVRLLVTSAQVFFLIIGFALVFFIKTSLPTGIKQTAIFITLLLTFLIGVLAYLSFSKGIGQVIIKFSKKNKWIMNHEEKLNRFDENTSFLFKNKKKKLFTSFVLSLSTWFIGATGLYIVTYGLGYPISFSKAIIIEAFTSAIVSSTMFIPGSIGTREGGYVLLFMAFTNFPIRQELALFYSLLVRMSEIFVFLLGFIFFFYQNNSKRSVINVMNDKMIEWQDDNNIKRNLNNKNNMEELMMLYYRILRYVVCCLLAFIPFGFVFSSDSITTAESDSLPSIFNYLEENQTPRATETDNVNSDTSYNLTLSQPYQQISKKIKKAKKTDIANKGEFAKVLFPFTKVQSGPSSKHGVITYLFSGDVVYIANQSEVESIDGKSYRWYFIQLQPNIYGWIYGKYLDRSSEYSKEWIAWENNLFYQDLMKQKDAWLVAEDREQLNNPDDNLVIENNEVLLRSLSGSTLRFPFEIVDTRIEWKTNAFLQSSASDTKKMDFDYSTKPGWEIVMTNRLIDSINIFQGNPAQNKLMSDEYSTSQFPKNYQNYALIVKPNYAYSLPIRKQKLHLSIINALRNQLVEQGKKYGIHFHLDPHTPYDKVIVHLKDINTDKVMMKLVKNNPYESESALYEDSTQISTTNQSVFDFDPNDYGDLAFFLSKREIYNNPDRAIFVLNTVQQIIDSILDNSKIVYTKSPLEVDTNS